MHTRGFPNCFIFSIVQSGFSVNFPHMLNEQAQHLAYVLAATKEREATVIEASAEAEAEWVRNIENLARNNMAFLEACTPGYYNNEGRPAERSVRNSSFGAGPVAFIKVLEQWRSAGDLAGLELT
jgi:cyclohexanone monooxygenase